MTGSERLGSILWEGQLRAFRTFSQGHPAVCFTESTVVGLTFLLQNRPYRPWGLIVSRDSVYDAGGGPVWYTRRPEYENLKRLGDHIRPWTVKLDGYNSDWLEEREWRIIPDPVGDPPSVMPLSRLKMVALLVGDPQWIPPRPPGVAQQPGLIPSSAAALPQFWWNASVQQLQLLPPLCGVPNA
ncbi:MAG TPA: hypothetical protein VGL88_05250 [Pseudonocardiaceae bacterium]|jgi:hypothetical protein